MHFLQCSVSVSRACILYMLTVYIHTVNPVLEFILREQLHPRWCKRWGVAQTKTPAYCARDLRFGPQFHNQPTHPTNERIISSNI